MKLAKENFKVQIFITSLGVLLLAVKTVAYLVTHSLSVLTDALESIVNVVAGFIGLYSLYVAAKPKDVDHPYGHGKAEFISAAAEGTSRSCSAAEALPTENQETSWPAVRRGLDPGSGL